MRRELRPRGIPVAFVTWTDERRRTIASNEAQMKLIRDRRPNRHTREEQSAEWFFQLVDAIGWVAILFRRSHRRRRVQ